jgi:hypothetical protein
MAARPGAILRTATFAERPSDCRSQCLPWTAPWFTRPGMPKHRVPAEQQARLLVGALRLAAFRDEPHSAGIALPVMQAESGYPRGTSCACWSFHKMGFHAVHPHPLIGLASWTFQLRAL